MNEAIQKGVRDCFVMVVKLSIMELECVIHECLERGDHFAAMKACGDMAPMMNKYIDDPVDRENIVLTRWKACCDRIGVDWMAVKG